MHADDRKLRISQILPLLATPTLYNGAARFAAAIWTGWPPQYTAQTDLLAEFRRSVQRQSHRTLTIGLVTLLLTNLVFWLQDYWAFAALPEVLTIMGRGRASLTVLGLLILAAAWIRPRWTYPLAVSGCIAGIGLLSYTLGQIGGLDTPWPYLVLPFFLLTVGGWIEPWARAMGLLAMGATCVAAFMLSNDAFLSSPLTVMATGSLVFVLGVALLLGCVADYSRVHNFIAQAELARERSRLVQRVKGKSRAVVALSHRIDAVRHAERASLAHDLSASLGQALSDAKMLARLASQTYATEPLSIGENLQMIEASLQQLTEQSDSLLRSVHSGAVTERTLDDSLAILCERTAEVAQIEVLYTRPEETIQSSDQASMTIWQSAQDLLSAVANEHTCQRAHLQLEQTAADLVLTMDAERDSAAPARTASMRALTTLRPRIEALGGRLSVELTEEHVALTLHIPRESTPA